MKTNLPKDKIIAVANDLVTNYPNQIDDHIKVQKILYFLDLDYKKKNDEPFFSDQFEAWIYGPVSRRIFSIIRENGLVFKTDYELSDDDKKFIKKDVKQYLKYDSFDLVLLSHQSQPWIEARKGFPSGEPCTKKIKL